MADARTSLNWQSLASIAPCPCGGEKIDFTKVQDRTVCWLECAQCGRRSKLCSDYHMARGAWNRLIEEMANV